MSCLSGIGLRERRGCPRSVLSSVAGRPLPKHEIYEMCVLFSVSSLRSQPGRQFGLYHELNKDTIGVWFTKSHLVLYKIIDMLAYFRKKTTIVYN